MFQFKRTKERNWPYYILAVLLGAAFFAAAIWRFEQLRETQPNLFG